jgi:hypothetical protein
MLTADADHSARGNDRQLTTRHRWGYRREVEARRVIINL